MFPYLSCWKFLFLFLTLSFHKNLNVFINLIDFLSDFKNKFYVFLKEIKNRPPPKLLSFICRFRNHYKFWIIFKQRTRGYKRIYVTRFEGWMFNIFCQQAKISWYKLEFSDWRLKPLVYLLNVTKQWIWVKVLLFVC